MKNIRSSFFGAPGLQTLTSSRALRSSAVHHTAHQENLHGVHWRVDWYAQMRLLLAPTSTDSDFAVASFVGSCLTSAAGIVYAQQSRIILGRASFNQYLAVSRFPACQTKRS